MKMIVIGNHGAMMFESIYFTELIFRLNVFSRKQKSVQEYMHFASEIQNFRVKKKKKY